MWQSAPWVALVVKNPMQEMQVQSRAREVPLEKEMATPVFLPGESHGQRSLVGYSPWGYKELDNTSLFPGSRASGYCYEFVCSSKLVAWHWLHEESWKAAALKVECTGK